MFGFLKGFTGVSQTPEEAFYKELFRDNWPTYAITERACIGVQFALNSTCFKFAGDSYYDWWYDIKEDAIARTWITNKWGGYLSAGDIYYPNGKIYSWSKESPDKNFIWQYTEKLKDKEAPYQNSVMEYFEDFGNVVNTMGYIPVLYSKDLDDWLDYISNNSNVKFSCRNKGVYMFNNTKTNSWYGLNPLGIYRKDHVFLSYKKEGDKDWYQICGRPNTIKAFQFFSTIKETSLENRLLEYEQECSKPVHKPRPKRRPHAIYVPKRRGV